jgi:FAD/FMN-containing dehydrogenase
VQPGIVLDRLRDAAEEHGLTFGPDPATHAHCTLGGMMGNNSCGVHALMAGKTVDNVEALEVMTYDGLRLSLGPLSEEEVRAKANMGGREGEIYHKLLDLRDRYGDLIRSKFPDIPRRVSGYNLPDLLPERGFNAAKALIGSEGTCVTILEATLKLVHSPRHRVLAVMGFSDINDAAAAVPDVLPYKPIGLEAIDSRLIDFLRRKHMHLDNLQLFPEGHAWLLIEFGADSPEDAMAAAHRLDSFAKDDRRGLSLLEKPEEQARLWQVRESGLGVTAFVPGMRDGGPGWEDAAVDPSRLKDYLPEFRNLLNEYGYDCSLYGHFGQGCVHCRIDFDLITPSGIDHYRHFVEDAADLVVRYGGSLSGEHGDGQARAELLPRMFGNEIVQAFREFKAIWDPEGRMNPGKIVDAYRNDQNLRLGAGYEPAKVQTHFSYDHEGGSFDLATLHCVGVGNCRNEEGGTMCPSYRVTHEEKHSTRGRARLLFEMLHGDPLTKLWKEEAVKDALDLCLACKGCKSECPVNVDMATYKAEFLSHYYEKRLRPRSAYAFGLIFRWARLAQAAPWLVNLMTQTPGLGRLAKLAAGVAPQRQIPRFARTPLLLIFRSRAPA